MNAKRKSVAGQFLIASPHLTDGNFLRTVVLMIEHDKEGALGLVLTRPLNSTLRDIWELIGEPKCALTDPLFWGGPVQSPLIALHSQAALAETKVIDGVYLSTHKDKLEQLVTQCLRPLRICSGYAGWGPGQLDFELKAGGWLVAPANAELTFSPYEALWEQMTRAVSHDITAGLRGTGAEPADPSLN